MSLIINMLKDLEKRENNLRDMPDIAITNDISAIRMYASMYLPTNRIIVYSGLLAILLIPITILVAMRTSTTPTHHIISPSSPIQMQKVVSAINTETWLAPVKINGITLQTNNNISDIRFLLDHHSLYRIANGHIQNHLILTLENAELQSELPLIDYQNTGIQNLTAHKINNNIQFDIILKSGSTIKDVTLSQQEKNPELGIKIETPAAQLSTVDTSPSELVKKPISQDLLTQQYQAALAIAQNGDYKTAISNLTALLKNERSFHQARASLVALMIETGNHFKAELTLEDGIQLAPEYIPYVELKARLMTMKGDIKGALALLQQSSPGMDNYPDYYAYIAALYERLNKNVMAANIYRQLLKLDTENSSWWFGLGLSLDKSGNKQEALSAYNHALSQGKLDTVSLAYLQKRMQTLQEATHEAD